MILFDLRMNQKCCLFALVDRMKINIPFHYVMQPVYPVQRRLVLESIRYGGDYVKIETGFR